MNKKSLIICISALAALAVLIVVAVVRLFSDSGNASGQAAAKAVQSSVVLAAVPTDASMIASFSRFKDAVAVMNDTSKVFRTVLSDSDKNSFRLFFSLLKDKSLKGLSDAEAVISMYNSGNIAPLLIVAAGSSPADTTVGVKNILECADSAHLYSRLVDCSLIADEHSPLIRKTLLAVSSVEALVTSVTRHVESGSSVLDRTCFPETVSMTGGKTSIYVSHDHIGKLMSVYMNRKYSSSSDFFRNVADWSGFSVEEANSRSVVLRGNVVSGENPSYYANVVAATSPGEILAPEMLPPSTEYAVSIAFEDCSAYETAYMGFRDAVRHLDSFRDADQQFKKSASIAASQLAQRLDVKEVTRVKYRSGDKFDDLLLVRIAKEDVAILLRGTGMKSLKEYQGVVTINPYIGFTGLLYGKEFSLQDEGYRVYINGWLIIGSESAVTGYVKGDYPHHNLKSHAEQAGLSIFPSRDKNLMAYFSVTENPAVIGKVFRPFVASSVRECIEGVAYAPAVFTMSSSEGRVFAELSVSEVEYVKSESTVMVEKDTVVVVPKGPFKVKNFATGKTNLFNQSANMYLTLSEENGKGIWGVPFKTPICGYVETIDYYGNGKLQFLFASESKIYLIDRLGRFVTGFPVELGKKVVLGPAAYDFTGANGYTILVLHDDNRIEMYNLHGKKPSNWKGITAKETIKSLPELITVKNKKYWAVRTSIRTLVYPFYGGEPLTKETSGKMIRPDSHLEINDKGVLSVECVDGKQRSVKLD